MSLSKHCYIDPSYPGLENNRLFDEANAGLDRDGQLQPFSRLQKSLQALGVHLQTGDKLLTDEPAQAVKYWSCGMTERLQLFERMSNVQCVGFLIMEPPLVAPNLYRALPALTRQFERVYVYNVHGDGYSLEGVNVSRLRRLYFPQPYSTVQSVWDQTERLNKTVVIAGRHSARRRKPEYYSLRIAAMAELAKMNAVDLYGRGWDKLASSQTLSWPYLRNYTTLRSIYKGTCLSKMEVLGRYRFSLCFENMPMNGYVTEKIFDCFYAGVVPLYLGAPDIAQHVPAEAFVDVREFDSWGDAWRWTREMDVKQWQRMRDAGRAFIESAACQAYVQSFENMFLQDELA